VNDLLSSINLIGVVPFLFFLVMLLFQRVWPRRNLAANGAARMLHNLLLFVVNAVLMRFAVPIAIVGVASWANLKGIGIFNFIVMPHWLAVLLCVVLLDFAIYWQHVATHKFPILWKMHKVHHADANMDVTTAVRFHPLELLLSLFYKTICVILLGPPVVAVIIFELLLFIGPAFNHSNVTLPYWLDRLLRTTIATPDTHRAHHSILIAEQNTNYGFFIIWWDKLFNTYTEEPAGGHVQMAIGLESPNDQCERIDQMLVAPLKRS